MTMLLVQKYGGTSLADGEKILAAARRAVELAREGNEVVMVVSAQGHTTDQLISQAKQINPQCSMREMDAFLATGEQMSASLMAMAIESLGWPAISLTGWQAGIWTDETHGYARIKSLGDRRILRELRKGRIVVVAGFQGLGSNGDITTLGRGGSDTTAVALAAFLHAQLCQIYTDVDGVYDRDPRRFSDAVRYEKIGYDDMLALIRDGAQVLHDRSVEFAKEYGIILEVLSAFRDVPGTLVGNLD
jgi:aspartate kinase